MLNISQTHGTSTSLLIMLGTTIYFTEMWWKDVFLTGGKIKTRISQHTSDFKFTKNENNTTLAQHIHKLQNEGKTYDLKWSLLDRGPVYNSITKKCRLCLLEKFYIIFKTETASLNRRSELFNTCRHRNQKILGYSQGKKRKK